MTSRQKQFLDFIRRYQNANGESPTYQNIGEHLGVGRPRVHDMVCRLEALGHIRRTPNQSRSIEIAARIPIYDADTHAIRGWL